MADEYDALEAAASSFKASAGIVDKGEDRRSSSRHHSSRDDGRSSREHRSSRDERDGRERDGGRDDKDRGDRDRERHRSDRDRERGERERGDRDRDRGDRERRDYDSRDSRDPRGTRRPRDEYEHPPRDDRRGRYDDPPHAGMPPPPRRRSPGMGMVARSMRDDTDYGRPPPRDYPPRDDYRGGGGMRGGGGRRDDRMDDRRGGGGGRGRERDGFGSPDRHRSPTPPGAVPISERRRIRATKWDETMPEFAGLSAMQAKMTGQFPAPGPNRQPIPASGAFSGFPGAPGGAAPMGFGMPVRQSKRLYIGNITPDVSEKALLDMFNGKMREHGFAVDLPGEPVANLQVNHEKSYAFVEFRIPEEATSALAFDGVVVAGVALKIRRPKDYAGPEGPLGTLHVPGVIGTTVADTPNKVYVGGLPTYLQDEQVIELLKSFGELKSFNLVKEGGGQTGVSKGFAFCEYVDETVTDMAIQGLNGFQLADRTLSVQRAQHGRGQNPSMAYSGTGANAPMMNQPRTLAQLAPNILASAAAADAQAAPTSRCMLLLNMVTQDDLVDDQDYQEILEDVTEECSKYGEVEGVRVPRPTKRDAKWMPGATAAAAKAAAQKADEEAGVGRVFVLFKDLEGVGKALKGIAGRQFGGRTILCASVAEDEFLGPAPPPPPPAEPPSLEDEAARAIADITG